MIKNILLVGLGGALGSIARYICQKLFADNFSHSFPWATLAVNITGCLLIGVFWGMSFSSFDTNENWKLFLMTGLCGGFTTFSAFTVETMGLLKQQRTGEVLFYVAGSVVLGLLATWAGMRLIKMI